MFAERIILEPLMFRRNLATSCVRTTLLPTFVSNRPCFSLWANDYLFPAYLCAISALILVVHRVACSAIVQRLATRLLVFRKPPIEQEESDDAQLEIVSSPHEGIVNDIKTHIVSLGGPTIFVYKILRLLGCLALVALTIATLIINDYHDSSGNNFVAGLKKRKGKKKSKSKKPSESFSSSEWLQISLCLAYVCVQPFYR